MNRRSGHSTSALVARRTQSKVRWRGDDWAVVDALFAKTGFHADLEEATVARDDPLLFASGDLLKL